MSLPGQHSSRRSLPYHGTPQPADRRRLHQRVSRRHISFAMIAASRMVNASRMARAGPAVRYGMSQRFAEAKWRGLSAFSQAATLFGCMTSFAAAASLRRRRAASHGFLLPRSQAAQPLWIEAVSSSPVNTFLIPACFLFSSGTQAFFAMMRRRYIPL